MRVLCDKRCRVNLFGLVADLVVTVPSHPLQGQDRVELLDVEGNNVHTATLVLIKGLLLVHDGEAPLGHLHIW